MLFLTKYVRAMLALLYSVTASSDLIAAIPSLALRAWRTNTKYGVVFTQISAPHYYFLININSQVGSHPHHH
jgi:hypothetical protein